MKSNILTYILIPALLCFAHLAYSQQKDFVGLTGLSVSKNFSRSFDASIGLQTMFYQNLSELWIGFGDVSVGYKINKSLNTELHYRNIKFRSLENAYESRHLFYHTLSYYRGFGKFVMSVRNRTQQLVFGEHFNDRFKGPRWYIREKFSLKYRINYYWAPFVSTEVFLPLNNPQRKEIDQYRVTGGVSYDSNEYFRIDFYYQLQQQLNRSGNDAYYVLGVAALIKIP